MKKILFVLFLLISVLSFGQTYRIETSRGVQILEIPEGSSIEETLIEISKMYWEERYDLEDLLVDHANLIEKSEGYKNDVDGYKLQVSELISDYDELEKLYNKKERLKNFIFFPTIGISYDNTNISGEFGFGLFLFQRFYLGMDVGIPYKIGIVLGFKLF